MTVEAPVTVREVPQLLLAADSYPRLGNHDWREADLLEAEALHKAAAEPRADDPPEFAARLAENFPVQPYLARQTIDSRFGLASL